MVRMRDFAQNPMRYMFVIGVLLFCLIGKCLAQPITASSPTFSECEREQCRARFNKYLNDMQMTNTMENIEIVQRHFQLSPITGVVDDPTCAVMLNRWNRKYITWRLVKMDPTRTNRVPSSSFKNKKRILERSFKAWTNITSLMFIYVDNDDADIQIKFRNSNCMAHPSSIVLNFTTSENEIDLLACVYPPGDKRNAGDIHFIGDEEWSNGDSREEIYDISLSTVSFNAIAYALGFNEYSENGALVPVNHTITEINAEKYLRNLYGKPNGKRRN